MFRKQRAMPELRPVHERPCMVLYPRPCPNAATVSIGDADYSAVVCQEHKHGRAA